MIRREKLNPFGKFCCTIGNLPTSYMLSLTYEEQLIWFCRYLEETVIPAVNNNAEALEELQNLFIELKTYVDEYFENLDVQEEINNKLDDMAESGQLTDIIAQYLQLAGILAYDTMSDLKSAENLVSGSLVKTYGYHSYNDGGGALYKVRDVINTDDPDDMLLVALTDVDLVAELVETEKINVKQLGAYGDNTHDDTESLKCALTNFNKVTIPEGTYIINEIIEPITTELIGHNCELKNTVYAGDYILKFDNDITIKNIKFNSNNVGRGFVYVSDSNVTVENCEFTGYSLTGGHYNTDSLLLVHQCDSVTVSNCYFHDSGYELENIVDNLNRAITVQDSDKVYIENCKFIKVMQAMVLLNNKSTVTGCYFDEVTDNNIYNLKNETYNGDIIVSNCYISNKFDEGIVTNGDNNIISNNIIENIPGKAINLNGNVVTLIITNNIFKHLQNANSTSTGYVLGTRDLDYTAEKIVFSNNTVTLDLVTDSSRGCYLEFPETNMLNIANNNISYYGTSSGRGIIIHKANKTSFINNLIEDVNNNATGIALEFTTTPTENVIYANNNYGTLRIRMYEKVSNIDRVTPNIGPYMLTSPNKILYSNNVPSTGTWTKGDLIIYNGVGATGGYAWICTESGTPGTWRTLS